MVAKTSVRRTFWGAPFVVLALALTACGGASAPSTSTAPSAKALRVAILLPGTVTDQGYNADGKRAADTIKQQLGATAVFTEGVSVPGQADIYRQYATQGYDLVIGWGGQFTDGAVAVAKEFPKVKFLVVNSGVSNGSNLASLDTNVEQWQFLGGYVVAKLSKSGVVGWVGGQCFPATAANLHGTEQGAKFANPNIRFLSTFTGDFEDPTKAQNAARAMIGQGADVLTGNLNNGWFGIFQAARAAGNRPVITEWTDNHSLAADVIAASILKSQARFVVATAKSVQDGTFKGAHVQDSLPPDWGPAISKTDLLPNDLYQAVLGVQSKISSGDVKPQHDETCPKA